VLPAAYIVYVVRHGTGSMPPFTPTELTDAQLARLAKWLARPKGAAR
jgi:mono/diheme cytochrome c family protein